MQVVVVATDGSEASYRAVDAAATLAVATGAKLIAITVGNPAQDRDDILSLARVEGGVGEAIELIAGAILQEAKQRAHQFGLSSVEGQHCGGEPVAVIMDVARQRRADIVVVGRRGRNRMTGLLLGSVSQKLVSLSPCPVMVVP